MTVVKYIAVWRTTYEGEEYFVLTSGKGTGEGPYILKVPDRDEGCIKTVGTSYEHVGDLELPERMGAEKQAGWLKTRPDRALELFDLEGYLDYLNELAAISGESTRMSEAEPYKPGEAA